MIFKQEVTSSRHDVTFDKKNDVKTGSDVSPHDVIFGKKPRFSDVCVIQSLQDEKDTRVSSIAQLRQRVAISHCSPIETGASSRLITQYPSRLACNCIILLKDFRALEKLAAQLAKAHKIIRSLQRLM